MSADKGGGDPQTVVALISRVLDDPNRVDRLAMLLERAVGLSVLVLLAAYLYLGGWVADILDLWVNNGDAVSDMIVPPGAIVIGSIVLALRRRARRRRR